MNKGWIGVDLDGTLAEYHGWPADGSIGAPVPAMVERVKKWLAEGQGVRIFTARIWPIGTTLEGCPDMRERTATAWKQVDRIVDWCQEHLGKALPITCVKDFNMIELWDDRAVQVEPNTGRTRGNRTIPTRREEGGGISGGGMTYGQTEDLLERLSYIGSGLHCPRVKDEYGFSASVADGLYEVAKAIRELTEAIRAHKFSSEETTD